MNKTNLQKEPQEKVKQREKNINLNEDEGYISDNSLSRNNRNKKNLNSNKTIQQLEKDIKF